MPDLFPSPSAGFPATIRHAAAPPAARSPTADVAARARDLETAFLAQMLKAAGTVRMGSGLPGAEADQPFEPFWAEAQARALMAAGGLGLAEVLARTLAARAAGGAA